MENRQQQILSEIKSMMASVRSQLEMLDAKMAELQQAVDPEDFAAEPIDLDLEIEETPEADAAETVSLQEIPLEEPVGEPAGGPAEESVEETVAVPEVEADDDLPEAAPVETALEEDMPESIFVEPEVVTIASRAKSEARLTINDSMADNCAWRHDMPGAPVKDIRSAISLNDRVIFINLLFGEDAQTFVNTLSHINTLDTLDQAVEYIVSCFPSWDMNSDLVYRFMMAVRRKVR